MMILMFNPATDGFIHDCCYFLLLACPSICNSLVVTSRV